ncbi:hypothetical protein PIB30_073131, partial [Stylosanthes scabra]|nr:hypothetical protein [Stylosanthes scabra]
FSFGCLSFSYNYATPTQFGTSHPQPTTDPSHHDGSHSTTLGLVDQPPLFNLSLNLTPSTTTVASPHPEAQLSHLVAIAATPSQQQRSASFPAAPSIPSASSFPFSAILPSSSVVPLSVVASCSAVPNHSTFLKLKWNLSYLE